MTLKQDLTAVRDLLSDPNRWTQGWLAMNKHRLHVHPQNESATCWCLVGAGRKLLPFDRENEVNSALYHAIGDGRSIANFNDHPNTRHSDVLALLDKAIANA
ncbi:MULTISPECIES: hypothetical protein [unclassified Beijerinckia]|uniref:DUF6197 family protein n=1 Tax=unclassified Beijerinckia TaxID=2638183 RepID=UPI0008988174|nr:MULTISPECIES: hypothetical protein [unclassified Beijerinckia]MDH7796406.1 hypothetical protein [Beijerinckia sp. GAS462]SEC43751.1 hypothetical protein SAMN05443249_2688 [Beijerinckia sp. 28-YEA-48]